VRFLKAHKIFDGKHFLPNDSVLVLDQQNLLKEITPEKRLETSKIELFEGIITPGFVNVHCHLELSHLKDMIPEHTGLPDFARNVIIKRNGFSEPQIQEAMQQADKDMWEKGIVAVGDISNNHESFKIKQSSKIFYHTFIELIGLNPDAAGSIMDKGIQLVEELKRFDLKGSLAPHAPYSTSTSLIEKIVAFDKERGQSLSIHNQESEEETKFFAGMKNGFEELYRFLNLNISWFKAPGISSLSSYLPTLKETKTILVHNTFTTADDIKQTQNKTVFWCFCPGANLYIENKLPDYHLFKDSSERICLGTDSLASNSTLDLVTEANHILKHSEAFSFENILKAMTYNSADALGIQHHYGQFVIGKNPGLNLISYENNQIKFIKKIV
jgi:aminodeoxyfutalosine deaminase